jgi:hypothetical protein
MIGAEGADSLRCGHFRPPSAGARPFASALSCESAQGPEAIGAGVTLPHACKIKSLRNVCRVAGGQSSISIHISSRHGLQHVAVECGADTAHIRDRVAVALPVGPTGKIGYFDWQTGEQLERLARQLRETSARSASGRLFRLACSCEHWISA